MAQIDVYGNDGVTAAVTIDTPGNPMMVVWGTRIFLLADPTTGEYVEQAGSQQAVSLPKMQPRPPIGATDGWRGWDKI